MTDAPDMAGVVEPLRWEDLIEMTDDEALAAIDAHIAAKARALTLTGADQ
jgi:hypothetical protein